MAVKSVATATTQPNVNMTFKDPAYEEIKAKTEKITQYVIDALKSKIWQDKDIDQFTCPITSVVCTEPVIDEHGHTFEKTAIQKWLQTSPNCPINRQPINTLIPNLAVQQAIERWQKQDPIPTFSLFKKSIPELAQKNLAMVQDYVQAGECEEAIGCYARAFQYSRNWEDYQKLPILFEKNQQKDHALLSYLYLLQYQLQDLKIPEALNTISQCISKCPVDYPFNGRLLGLRDVVRLMTGKFDIVHSNIAKGIYALHLLEGYKERVGSIFSADGRLYSCPYDNTIKIWDLKAELPTYTANLKGHTEIVYSLAIANGKLYSGSGDKTIKIWDLNTTLPTCVGTLTHTKPVFSLAIGDDGKLFSHTGDEINIWDLNTNPPHCIAKLPGGKIPAPGTIIFGNRKLFTSYFLSEEIKIWDLNTSPPTCAAFKEHSRISSLTYDDGKFFLGFWDGVIKILDPNTNPPTCIATFKGHKDQVQSLVIAHGKLFSRSFDLSIKIWDLSTNPPTSTAAIGIQCGARFGAMLAFANGKLCANFSDHSDKAIQVYDFTATQNTDL